MSFRKIGSNLLTVALLGGPLTGKRTLMQYLLKPILRAKSNALIER